MTNGLIASVLLGCALITLSGCDSFRHTFGLDHYQPDEFNVYDHPPLSLPPDYSLRPPKEEGKMTQAPSKVSERKAPAAQKAQKALLGKTVDDSTENLDQTEKSLVTKAEGNTPIDPNIRTKINREAAIDTNVSDSLSQRITTWKTEFEQNLHSYKTPNARDPQNQPAIKQSPNPVAESPETMAD